MGRKKKTALDGESRRGSEKGNRRTHYPAESARSQCARLLRYLRDHGPIDTREARRRLDIMHPGGRISDLRHKVGLLIVTEIDPDTRIATYHLMPGGADNG